MFSIWVSIFFLLSFPTGKGKITNVFLCVIKKSYNGYICFLYTPFVFIHTAACVFFFYLFLLQNSIVWLINYFSFWLLIRISLLFSLYCILNDEAHMWLSWLRNISFRGSDTLKGRTEKKGQMIYIISSMPSNGVIGFWSLSFHFLVQIWTVLLCKY